jgi:hypothetical protein
VRGQRTKGHNTVTLTPKGITIMASTTSKSASSDTAAVAVEAPAKEIKPQTLYNRAKKNAFDRLRKENPEWTAIWESTFREERIALGLTPREKGATRVDKFATMAAALVAQGVDVAALVAAATAQQETAEAV